MVLWKSEQLESIIRVGFEQRRAAAGFREAGNDGLGTPRRRITRRGSGAHSGSSAQASSAAQRLLFGEALRRQV